MTTFEFPTVVSVYSFWLFNEKTSYLKEVMNCFCHALGVFRGHKLDELLFRRFSVKKWGYILNFFHHLISRVSVYWAIY